MGVIERRERQRAALRERIVTAARDLVAEGGFEALTMRKIADAVEYSPGAIYLHFAGRDEIAFELVLEGYTALLRYLQPACAIDDPEERLRAFGAAYLAFAQAEPQWYRLIFLQDQRYAEVAFGSADGAGKPGDDAIGILVDVCRELIDRSVYRAMDPQLAALMLWSGLHGLASLALACPQFASIDEHGAPMIAMLDRGLRP